MCIWLIGQFILFRYFCSYFERCRPHQTLFEKGAPPAVRKIWLRSSAQVSFKNDSMHQITICLRDVVNDFRRFAAVKHVAAFSS